MALISTIEQVRKYLRVKYTNSTATLPDIGAAEDRFIIPLIGQDLYDGLDAAQTAEGVPDLTLSLLDKVRRCIVALAYWQDLPTIHTQIGELGVVVAKSENLDPAHRWEFENLRESLAVKACAALDVLISFLIENKTDLSWTNPSDTNTLISSGIEFSKYFTIYQPNRTFFSLLPLLKEVEDEYIRAQIGDDFFEELRDNAAPSDKEKKAILLIKKSIAYLTIYKSVSLLPVRISAEGFTVSLGINTDQTNQGQQHSPDSTLGRLADKTEQTGNKYLSDLKTYLDENAGDTVFGTYKASAFYTAPDTPASISLNANRNGVFGL